MAIQGQREGAEKPPADRTQTLVRRSGSSDSGRAHTPEGPHPATPAPDDTSGDSYQLIEGDPDRYTNKGEHARGGLGRVLRAHDHRLGRTVAIKELLQTSSSAEARFVREALITARLQHPGVVPVHEAGRWPNGEPYYVMKLISGRSMKELIRDRAELRDRLALLPSVIAVAETVAYAHSEGIIHRDIKPANVMVGDYGETVVVDWGIAKDRSGQVAPPEETGISGERTAAQTAGVLGTPAYMPPEQANGEEVDERADVYAIGALLYEVLAGEQPYSGDESGDVLAKVIAGPPRPLEQVQPSVPPDLLAIVRKSMARRPAQRYRSAKELAEDLKRFQTGKLVTAHDYSTMTLVKRFVRRNRALVAGTAIALGVVSVLGVLAVERIVEERNVARDKQAEAEAANAATEKRRRQLLLLQAKSSLDDDPTAAIAWLKTYPQDAPGWGQVRAMVDEAEALGVARHVIELEDWGHGVDFSPDGKLLAAGGVDRKLRLIDTATGISQIIATHDRPLFDLAFSPRGDLIATATEDGVVHLWRPNGDPVGSAEGHRGGGLMSRVAFSPDGALLISTDGERHSVKVWTVPGLEPRWGRTGRSAISPAGDTVAVLDQESKTPLVYDLASGKTTELPALPEGQQMVAVGSGGAIVAAVDEQGVVHAIRPGQKTWKRLGSHPARLHNLQISPSGERVVTVGWDRLIRIFDADGEGEPEILRGHDDAVYRVTFAKDERYMVSASDDGTARIWNLSTGESRALRGHEDDLFRVVISPNGDQLATISLDGSVRLWPAGGDPGRRLVHPAPVGKVDYTADGTLISVSFDGSVRATAPGGEPRLLGETDQLKWPMPLPGHAVGARHIAVRDPDHRTIRVWPSAGGEPFELAADGEAFDYVVYGAFSPDDRYLVATYKQGAIVRWDLASRKPTVIGRGDRPGPVAFSPDGREVAVAHAGGLTVWNLAQEQVALDDELEMKDGYFGKRQVLYSPDGRWLAVMSSKGDVALFDRGSGERRNLPTGEARLTHAAFSDDGRWLAASGSDRTVRLWDLERGEARVLRGHTDLVYDVAFRPGSTLFATSSHDKTVRLWDATTGEAVVLRGHRLNANSVSFSPDGATLASGSQDGTVRLWDVEEILARGTREAVTRRLSEITTATIDGDDRPATRLP